MKQIKLTFPPIFKNYLICILTRKLFWSRLRGFCSSHPASGGKFTVDLAKLVRVERKTRPVQQHSPQRQSKWGHNYLFLVWEVESVSPPPESGLAPALLWAKECSGGGDDVWLLSLLSKGLVSFSFDPQNPETIRPGWKTPGDRGPALPALPDDCKVELRGNQQKNLAPPQANTQDSEKQETVAF